MEIIALEHKHALSYIIKGSSKCVLYDAGWSDSYPVFVKAMKKNGIALGDIVFFVVSHFHPDHAGCVQVFKNNGVPFYIHECQQGYTGDLNRFHKKHPDRSYVPINEEGHKILTTNTSRKMLKDCGINGEIIHTPGHSADGISLILDEGYAFTGDLMRFDYIDESAGDDLRESWEKILSYGVKTIYPAHGVPYQIKP